MEQMDFRNFVKKKMVEFGCLNVEGNVAFWNFPFLFPLATPSSRLVSRTEFSSQGVTGTRGCIPESHRESGLVSRGSKGLCSPFRS